MKTEFESQIIQEKSLEVESFIEENGSLFHKYDFLSCVGENYRCFLVLNKISGEIAALLPLVKTKKFGLKSYHIPAFAYQFGPIISNEYLSHQSEILSCLLRPIIKEKHLDFKLFVDDGNILPFKERSFAITPSQTHVFPINCKYGLDIISKDKARDVSRLLKKTEEKSLKIIENDKSNLPFILKMWNETSDRANFDAHLKILEQIFSSDINHYSNIIFDSKGNPLAGAYCPFDSKRMYHLIGASTRSTDSILNRSNILSLFLAITYANNHRLEFDFEGSNISGVAKFYRMMGGRPKITYRMQKTRSLYYHVLKAAKTIKEERS